jgi:hypothetical protein
LYHVRTGSGHHLALYPVGMDALSIGIKWLIVQLLHISCRMYGTLFPHAVLLILFDGLGTVPAYLLFVMFFSRMKETECFTVK